MTDPWHVLAPVVAGGDRLESLRALRDRLGADIDACKSARDVASLGRLLTDVLAEIHRVEQATPDTTGTPLDELARRRDSRPPDQSGSGRAVRPPAR